MERIRFEELETGRRLYASLPSLRHVSHGPLFTSEHVSCGLIIEARLRPLPVIGLLPGCDHLLPLQPFTLCLLSNDTRDFLIM